MYGGPLLSAFFARSAVAGLSLWLGAILEVLSLHRPSRRLLETIVFLLKEGSRLMLSYWRGYGSCRRWDWSFATGPLLLLALGATGLAASPLESRKVQIPVRLIDHRFAVRPDENGVPRFNWERFRSRPENTVTENWDGVEFENSELKVVIIPAMGRIHSLVHKPTGQEQLWINPCARPLPAHNETGYWMTWGGIERVLPRGEHGTTHALHWDSELVVDREHQKTIRCAVTEPLTGLRHELRMTLYADKPYLETQIKIENATSSAARYSHWTTAVWAPGGKGEVQPDTELIVPAERFVPDDRPFNAWMLKRDVDARTSPLRWIQDWSSIGDLMTSPLRQPYYAVYAHGADQGIVHVFDLEATPTVDIWCWGYPPSAEHQAQFTAAPPNKGYVEVWNGNVANFKDESLVTLRPGEQIQWTERTFCVSGLLSNASELRKAIEEQAMRHQVTSAAK